MNAPLVAPAEWSITLRGYPARQWRRRLPAGGKREVALANLPADAADEVRRLEKSFGWKHGTLTVSREKDETIRVAVAFVARAVL